MEMEIKYAPSGVLVSLLIMMTFTACADNDNSGSGHEYNADDCRAVRDNCQAIAESACEEYECIETGPETTGCLIETKGYYFQTYYECAKEKVDSQCQMLLLWEKKCLANCYYSKVNEDSFDQAEQECMDQCFTTY
jgi:hypothetical protein